MPSSDPLKLLPIELWNNIIDIAIDDGDWEINRRSSQV